MMASLKPATAMPSISTRKRKLRSGSLRAMNQRSSAPCGGAHAGARFDSGSDGCICKERCKIGRGTTITKLGRAMMLRGIADRILVRQRYRPRFIYRLPRRLPTQHPDVGSLKNELPVSAVGIL